MQIFEKFAAFLFLLLLVGIIAFLTFVPVPDESRQVILIVIGGLMTAATQALPKLFGVQDDEKERLKAEADELKTRVRKLENEYAVLKENYDNLTKMLVERHVVTANGVEINAIGRGVMTND